MATRHRSRQYLLIRKRAWLGACRRCCCGVVEVGVVEMECGVERVAVDVVFVSITVRVLVIT